MTMTQTELARRLGVSQHTVSVAFGGTGRISDHTRQNVLEQARRLGYRPNGAARSIRTGAFRNVALLTTTDDSIGNLPKALLRGTQQEAERKGLTLMVTEHELSELENPDFRPRILKEHLADGLLINYHREAPPETVRLFRSFKLPTVWLNVRVQDPCVHPDDIGAGREAAEHLLRLGHRRIAYVSYHGERHYSIRDRCHGVGEALASAGLSPGRHQLLDGVSVPEGVGHATALLSLPDRPTAVVCYEQQEAVCIYVAATSLGLRVPVDLSIVSFGTSKLRTAVGLPITTNVVPFDALGRRALRRLVGLTRSGQKDAGSAESLAFDFQDEGSTGPPPPCLSVAR